jgi:hypothetical protein
MVAFSSSPSSWRAGSGGRVVLVTIVLALLGGLAGAHGAPLPPSPVQRGDANFTCNGTAWWALGIGSFQTSWQVPASARPGDLAVFSIFQNANASSTYASAKFSQGQGAFLDLVELDRVGTDDTDLTITFLGGWMPVGGEGGSIDFNVSGSTVFYYYGAFWRGVDPNSPVTLHGGSALPPGSSRTASVTVPSPQGSVPEGSKMFVGVGAICNCTGRAISDLGVDSPSELPTISLGKFGNMAFVHARGGVPQGGFAAPLTYTANATTFPTISVQAMGFVYGLVNSCVNPSTTGSSLLTSGAATTTGSLTTTGVATTTTGVATTDTVTRVATTNAQHSSASFLWPSVALVAGSALSSSFLN